MARIMDASRAVLAECGLEGLTVQEVVARARTSVGSFYARFSGKDELLRYLETTARADVEEQWTREFGARLEGASSLAGCVNVLVAALAETYCGQALRGRAQAALLGVAGELDLHVRDRISRVLLERRAEIRHPDPELAVRLGYLAVASVLRRPDTGLDDERLVTELARLWLSYLGGEGERGGPAAVDFFQVWT